MGHHPIGATQTQIVVVGLGAGLVGVAVDANFGKGVVDNPFGLLIQPGLLPVVSTG